MIFIRFWCKFSSRLDVLCKFLHYSFGHNSSPNHSWIENMVIRSIDVSKETRCTEDSSMRCKMTIVFLCLQVGTFACIFIFTLPPRKFMLLASTLSQQVSLWYRIWCVCVRFLLSFIHTFTTPVLLGLLSVLWNAFYGPNSLYILNA